MTLSYVFPRLRCGEQLELARVEAARQSDLTKSLEAQLEASLAELKALMEEADAQRTAVEALQTEADIARAEAEASARAQVAAVMEAEHLREAEGAAAAERRDLLTSLQQRGLEVVAVEAQVEALGRQLAAAATRRVSAILHLSGHLVGLIECIYLSEDMFVCWSRPC